MIRGLTTASSGLITNEQMQDLLSNNIANAQTPGFKSDDGIQGSFQELLLYRLNDHSASGPMQSSNDRIGRLGIGVHMVEAATRFTPGILKETGNATDFAIVDGTDPANPNRHGFFAVLKGNQVQLTRNGAFHTDGNGFLVDSLGNPVLAVATDKDGQAYPLLNSRVRLNGTPKVIDPNTNQAPVDPRTGERVTIGNLNPQNLILDVTDTALLRKNGNGYYNPPTGQPLRLTNGEYRQGFIESSNVDLAQSMVNMISVLRNYEANTRVVRTMDQTLQKAVNEVGKV